MWHSSVEVNVAHGPHTSHCSLHEMIYTSLMVVMVTKIVPKWHIELEIGTNVTCLQSTRCKAYRAAFEKNEKYKVSRRMCAKQSVCERSNWNLTNAEGGCYRER